MNSNIDKTDEKLCIKRKLHSAVSKQLEKTRIPIQKRSIETKMLIVNASMKLFSEKGFHNTNTKEIATEAGVATGCFYSYFDDKRAVFLEALKIYHKQFDEILYGQLNKIIELKDNKKEFLASVFRSVIDAHQVFSGFHNELIVMKYSDPDVTKIMEDKINQSRAETLKYLKNWQDEATTNDIEAASIVIFETIDAIVDTIMFSKIDVEDNRLIQVTIDMIMKYLFT